MATPDYSFFGLLEMPDNCGKNRLFGIACSTAEDGIIKSVIFDSLSVQAVCGGKTGGSVQVDTADPVCTSLNSGSLKVTVQGTAPPYLLVFGTTTHANSSLIDSLPQGDYALSVINGQGCTCLLPSPRMETARTISSESCIILTLRSTADPIKICGRSVTFR